MLTFTSGLSGELIFIPLLHVPGAGTAVTEKLSVRVAVPRIFSSSLWCAWLYLAAFSRVIWKQVPSVLLQDCYFHLFLSKERENIQSLFKCYCFSIRSGSNLKGETKIPVCICNFLLHYVHSGLPLKINKILKAKNQIICFRNKPAFFSPIHK